MFPWGHADRFIDAAIHHTSPQQKTRPCWPGIKVLVCCISSFPTNDKNSTLGGHLGHFDCKRNDLHKNTVSQRIFSDNLGRLAVGKDLSRDGV
jgi:hypothetical protein